MRLSQDLRHIRGQRTASDDRVGDLAQQTMIRLLIGPEMTTLEYQEGYFEIMIDDTLLAVVDQSRDKNEFVRLTSKTMSVSSREDLLTPQ